MLSLFDFFEFFFENNPFCERMNIDLDGYYRNKECHEKYHTTELTVHVYDKQ